MNAAHTVARRVAGAGVLLLAVAALLASLAMRADAIRVSRVLTGSMGGDVPPGALVVSRPVSPETIERGQVVLFAPPAPYGAPDGSPVAHRVVEVTRENGEVLFRTKGDANAAEDPWTVNASRSTVFRLAWSSALAGRAAEMAGRAGASVAVATVGLYAAARALVAIWRPRRAARDGRRRRAGDRRAALRRLRETAA